MTEIPARTFRKARKPHTCDWCGEAILRGVEYHHSTVWDLGPQSWKAHAECAEAAETMPDHARRANDDGELWPLEHMQRGRWVPED